MKVRKAIIPAAGMGTRVLPASKAVPKEMLNIVDKPAIQYIVEEAFASGIEEVLIITNRNKAQSKIILTIPMSLKISLKATKARKRSMRMCLPALISATYILRQKKQRSLGHAVLCAKNFVGNEPFAVLYGDDVILSETPCTKQLCDAYEKYGKGVVGVKEVPGMAITKYCSLKTEPLEGNCYTCSDMIEKPKPEEIMGNFSILGRVVLPPQIFDILEKTPLGAGNELQLTDAMKTLAQTDGVVAVDYEGVRYDMGNKFGILQANIEVGLKHPETKEELKAYLKKIAADLD